MNSKIRQLEDDLVSILNASDLPIEVKRLIVGNVYHATEKAADNAILRGKYEEQMRNAPIEEKGDLTDAEGS